MSAASPFVQTAQLTLAATTTSSNVQLPVSGSPSTVYISNLNSFIVYVLLGSSSVAVTPATGVPILPGQSIALGLGSNTYLAAIATGTPGATSSLIITMGV